MVPNRFQVRLVSILGIPDRQIRPKVYWPPAVWFASAKLRKWTEIAGKTHGFYVHNRITEDPRRRPGYLAEPADV